MKYRYYATFVPGLQRFISEVIKDRLADVSVAVGDGKIISTRTPTEGRHVVIHKLLDGAVLFETEVSYDKLNFFCFNNIFAVIDVKNLAQMTQRNAKDAEVLKNFILESLNQTSKNDVITNNNKKIKSFRMVFSSENTPIAVNEKLRADIEKYISHLSGLKVNRTNPDTEFWFLYRKEKDKGDFSIFMKRLTLRASWDKTLHKGELPPPLAWSLCRLAELKHSDTVLDPFCGYASIPEAALKYFHINKFIACDNDKNAAAFTKTRFKKRTGTKEDFDFYENDFSELPDFIGTNFIDVIVTDPPWGQYKEIDEAVFYKKMFEVFNKLLRKEGRAVVLCANNEVFINASKDYFLLKDTVPILLSGKKAVIFIFTKKGA